MPWVNFGLEGRQSPWTSDLLIISTTFSGVCFFAESSIFNALDSLNHPGVHSLLLLFWSSVYIDRRIGEQEHPVIYARFVVYDVEKC